LVLAFWITIEEEARYEEIVSFTQASRSATAGGASKAAEEVIKGAGYCAPRGRH
jgi:hypothetical protein